MDHAFLVVVRDKKFVQHELAKEDQRRVKENVWYHEPVSKARVKRRQQSAVPPFKLEFWVHVLLYAVALALAAAASSLEEQFKGGPDVGQEVRHYHLSCYHLAIESDPLLGKVRREVVSRVTPVSFKD